MTTAALGFRYPGKEGFALGPLHLDGPPDRPWLILGGTGSGKSTLLRLIAGSLKPQEGQRPGPEDVGYLPQLPERALGGRNLAEDLTGDLRPEKRVRGEARESLHRAGLEGISLARSSRDLSLGERRRVALALLLLSGVTHWALDEPDAGLDGGGVQRLIQVLKERTRVKSNRVWIGTHNPDPYRCLAPWAVVLDGGRLIAKGNLNEVMCLESVRRSLGVEDTGPWKVWKALSGAPKMEGIPELLDPPTSGGRLAQVHALLRDRILEV